MPSDLISAMQKFGAFLSAEADRKVNLAFTLHKEFEQREAARQFVDFTIENDPMIAPYKDQIQSLDSEYAKLQAVQSLYGMAEREEKRTMVETDLSTGEAFVLKANDKGEFVKRYKLLEDESGIMYGDVDESGGYTEGDLRLTRPAQEQYQAQQYQFAGLEERRQDRTLYAGTIYEDPETGRKYNFDRYGRGFIEVGTGEIAPIEVTERLTKMYKQTDPTVLQRRYQTMAESAQSAMFSALYDASQHFLTKFGGKSLAKVGYMQLVRGGGYKWIDKQTQRQIFLDFMDPSSEFRKSLSEETTEKMLKSTKPFREQYEAAMIDYRYTRKLSGMAWDDKTIQSKKKRLFANADNPKVAELVVRKYKDMTGEEVEQKYIDEMTPQGLREIFNMLPKDVQLGILITVESEDLPNKSIDKISKTFDY